MDPVEAAIFEALGKVAPGKSVSPEQVARVLSEEGWRRELGKVRAVAVGLARQEKLVILRHNKPADPSDFRGVWRMRLPAQDEGTAPEEAVPPEA